MGKALAHPLRISALEAMVEGPASPSMISAEVEANVSNVNYHVEVLEELGCIEIDHEVPIRGAIEHFYRIVPETFFGNREWRKVPAPLRRAVSGAALQKFMDAAIVAVKAGTLDCEEEILDWMPVHLDPRGRQEVIEVLDGARKALLAVHGKSKERMGETGEAARTYIVGLAGFETSGAGGRRLNRHLDEQRRS